MKSKLIILALFASALFACQGSEQNTSEEQEELDQVENMIDRDQQAMDSARKALLGDTTGS